MRASSGLCRPTGSLFLFTDSSSFCNANSSHFTNLFIHRLHPISSSPPPDTHIRSPISGASPTSQRLTDGVASSLRVASPGSPYQSHQDTRLLCLCFTRGPARMQSCPCCHVGVPIDPVSNACLVHGRFSVASRSLRLVSAAYHLPSLHHNNSMEPHASVSCPVCFCFILRSASVLANNMYFLTCPVHACLSPSRPALTDRQLARAVGVLLHPRAPTVMFRACPLAALLFVHAVLVVHTSDLVYIYRCRTLCKAGIEYSVSSTRQTSSCLSFLYAPKQTPAEN